VIGYYWAIALLGISTGALIGHAIWQMRGERREERHSRSVSVSQPPYPPYGTDFYGEHKRSFSTSETSVRNSLNSIQKL
jgi:hypothetical protein